MLNIDTNARQFYDSKIMFCATFRCTTVRRIAATVVGRSVAPIRSPTTKGTGQSPAVSCRNTCGRRASHNEGEWPDSEVLFFRGKNRQWHRKCISFSGRCSCTREMESSSKPAVPRSKEQRPRALTSCVLQNGHFK